MTKVTIICLLAVGFVTGIPTPDKEKLVKRPPSPVENPDLFEGDIELPLDDGFRSAVITRRLWKGGVIPYIISPKAKFDPEQLKNLTRAMDTFHEHTCVRWVPRKDEAYFIRFQAGYGCSSQVGKLMLSSGPLKNGQPITFDDWCFQKHGTLLHEMMHALGFFHEQSRLDRDDYIQLDSRWIRQGALGQFRLYDEDMVNKDLGAPYDYYSIMHYGPDAFSVYEDKQTIIPRKEGAVIGQRKGFSDIDIWKINKLYNCSRYESVTLPPEYYTTPAKVPLPTTEPTKLEDSLYCDFNFEYACGMRDDLRSDLDWKIGKKPPSYYDQDSGPQLDRDGNDCCFMHMDTIGGVKPGQKAYLTSPFFDFTTASCLQFSYNMHGKDIGSLRVYTRNFRGEIGKVLFEKYGDQGEGWFDSFVKVKSYEPFEIVFEATLGGDRYAFASDIGLDSIWYRPLKNMPRAKREKCV